MPVSSLLGLYGDKSRLSLKKAEAKKRLYFKDQPNVEAFFEKVKARAAIMGYTETAFGRRRYYDYTSVDPAKAESAKAAAMRQAGNAVIQGTAADIFKLALARTMKYIIKKGLFGKVILINMVHDELLFEIDATQVDVKKVTVDLCRLMAQPLPGYPPMFVGAGVSSSWAQAKSKACEIHPTLLDQLIEESKGLEIENPTLSAEEWIEYFDKRVVGYREEKVLGYLREEGNKGKALHPEVGNLMRMMYESKVDTEGLTDDNDITKACIDYLAEAYNINCRGEDFVQSDLQGFEEDEDKYYDEESEYDVDDIEFVTPKFVILEEEEGTDTGVSLQDLIKEFGLIVSKTRGVCGINVTNMSYSKKTAVFTYLLQDKQCDATDEGALRLVVYIEGTPLNRTNVYVKDIGLGEELEGLMAK